MTFNYTLPSNAPIYQNNLNYTKYNPLQYKYNFVNYQPYSFTPVNIQSAKSTNVPYLSYKPIQFKTQNRPNQTQYSAFKNYDGNRMIVNQQSKGYNSIYNGNSKFQYGDVPNNSNSQQSALFNNYSKKDNLLNDNKSYIPQNSTNGYPLSNNEKKQNYTSYSNFVLKTNYQTPSYGYNFNEPSSIMNNKNQTFLSNQNSLGQSKRSPNKKIEMTSKKQSFIPLRKTKQQMQSDDNQEDMQENKKVYDMLEVNKIKNFKQQDFNNKCGFNKNVMYNIDTNDDKKNSSLFGKWC